ncbi:MAG: TIGR04222 domain-containing membrane protein [Myxococcota bacterium]|nr:TIGR04222 domain-containing membrane protein [Myxococcota bacterium]
MSIIFENALATLDPGAYLGVYTLGVCAVAAGMFVRRQKSDETNGMRLPAIPEELDPHELAYLNGGIEELSRLVVFDLARRGWLEMFEESSMFGDDHYLKRAEDHPPVNLLRPIEKEVWDLIEGTVLMSNLMGTIDLPAHLDTFASDYRARLSKKKMMLTDAQQSSEGTLAAGAMVMVMAPGVYRMLIAMQARTEEWLAFLVWALLSGLLVWFCAKPRFRTNLGDRYLDALRREFDAMRDHMHIWGEAAAAHTATLAALFGARSVLRGTAAAELEYARRKAQSNP